MARRKSSVAEDFMDLIAMLPWWMGVALAVFFFVLFHTMAKQPAPSTLIPGHAGEFVGRSLGATFAMAAKYLVPMLCLFGALGSYLQRKRRERLVRDMQGAPSADALHGMSWQEFEWLVGEAFRIQGYEVTERGGAGADGGVDIELRKGRELFLVQCKQWKAFKVGVGVVRELYGVMTHRGATGGFVITSGTFSEDAREFVQGRNVRLIDGSQLFGLLQQAKARNGRVPPLQAATPPPKTETAEAPPTCPRCQSPMVRRTAKGGPAPGSQFWGCTKFPACRGTR